VSISLNGGDHVNLWRVFIVILVPTPMPDIPLSRHSWREGEPRTQVKKERGSLKYGRGLLDIYKGILERINHGETFQGIAIKYFTDTLGGMGERLLRWMAWWLLREEKLMLPSSVASLISSKMPAIGI
jgi:hypothetical protein